jgi:hypothetical protein
MPSLRDTQTAFCAAILSGDAASIRHLVRDDGMAPEERVQVYLNNHRVGSLATLQATYPVIERLGGSDWFSQSAAQFLAQFPSRSGDLQHLGEQYPDFLRVHLAETDYAYFADVAALEWAYQLALTAADRAPADLGVLHGVGADDYARLLFVARPAVRLIESRYPIFAIWHANQSSAAEPDIQIRLDAGASRVMLIRRADHVELRELSPGTFHLLQQFQRGATLGAAAASMATEAPEFDLEVCLREVIGLEAIADIKLCEEPDNQRKLPGESS